MSAQDKCTTAIIQYRKNRLNHRIVFGEPIVTIRRDWQRKIACFNFGQVFAYERWRADRYGTQDWRIVVCKAGDGGSVTQIPGINPGAIMLLNAVGPSRARQAHALFDFFKKHESAPLHAIPEYKWRQAANALETGQLASHKACLS